MKPASAACSTAISPRWVSGTPTASPARGRRAIYAQVSGTIVDQDHFDLSGDFTPAGPGTPGYAGGIANRFPFENGGNRDRSDFHDWRLNTKVGITPNATDEYSINYTMQEGVKDAPLHVNRQVVQGYFNGNNVRYWTWPNGISQAFRGFRKPSLATLRTSRPTPTTTPSKTRSRSSTSLRTLINLTTARMPTIRSAASSRWAPISYR